MSIKIPVNVSDTKAKLSDFFKKKATGAGASNDDKNKGANDDATRRANAQAAAKRKEAKELADKLNSATVTMEEKDKIIADLQKENADYQARIAEIEPLANQYKESEHKERHRLLAQLPPEKRKEAEDFPLNALRSYASVVAGTSGGDGAKAGGAAKGADGKINFKALIDGSASEEGLKTLQDTMKQYPQEWESYNKESVK